MLNKKNLIIQIILNPDNTSITFLTCVPQYTHNTEPWSFLTAPVCDLTCKLWVILHWWWSGDGKSWQGTHFKLVKKSPHKERGRSKHAVTSFGMYLKAGECMCQEDHQVAHPPPWLWLPRHTLMGRCEEEASVAFFHSSMSNFVSSPNELGGGLERLVFLRPLPASHLYLTRHRLPIGVAARTQHTWDCLMLITSHRKLNISTQECLNVNNPHTCYVMICIMLHQRNKYPWNWVSTKISNAQM